MELEIFDDCLEEKLAFCPVETVEFHISVVDSQQCGKECRLLMVQVECVQRHIIFVLACGKVEIGIVTVLFRVWLDAQQISRTRLKNSTLNL